MSALEVDSEDWRDFLICFVDIVFLRYIKI